MSYNAETHLCENFKTNREALRAEHVLDCIFKNYLEHSMKEIRQFKKNLIL